jgi:hypothetical protein
MRFSASHLGSWLCGFYDVGVVSWLATDLSENEAKHRAADRPVHDAVFDIPVFSCVRGAGGRSPRWVTWFGLVTALVLVSPLVYFSLLLLLLWSLLLGVRFVIRPGADPSLMPSRPVAPSPNRRPIWSAVEGQRVVAAHCTATGDAPLTLRR